MAELKVKSDCISRTSNLKHLGVAYRTMALGIGRPKFLIKKIVFDVLVFYVFPLSEISAFSLFLQRKKNLLKNWFGNIWQKI
jgi:hypothetical protein